MSWGDLVVGLGLVAVFEGLALALAPRRVEDALRLMAELPVDARRWIGLGTLAFGVIIVWIVRA